MALGQGKKQAPASSSLQPTPAPVERSKSFGRESYGANAYDGPSSLPPGQAVSAGLVVTAPNDATLKAVQAKGAKSQDDNFQTRTFDATPLPAAHGLKNQSNTGGKVPAKLGNNQSDPERQTGG